MKSEFDLLFEETMNGFGQEAPNAVVLVSDQPNAPEGEDDGGEEFSEGDSDGDVIGKLDKQFKGLRKVASGNKEGGKIYYRARKIQKLIDELKSRFGVATATENDSGLDEGQF